MGPSGSGKTTLLNLVGGLEIPSSGAIEVLGRTLTGASDQELTAYRRHTVGFVFQTFHLIPTLTALENVITPMVAVRTLRNRKARARAGLESVGLGGQENQLPGELSGGEQQRVAIARALIMEPKLLLADEPTGNLDVTTAASILDLIDRIRRDRDLTVLLATHDPAVALRADRVIGLNDGKMEADVSVTPQETPESLIGKLTKQAEPA
jgi:putative ABC transport system ATP-binding protein